MPRLDNGQLAGYEFVTMANRDCGHVCHASSCTLAPIYSCDGDGKTSPQVESRASGGGGGGAAARPTLFVINQYHRGQ